MNKGQCHSPSLRTHPSLSLKQSPSGLSWPFALPRSFSGSLQLALSLTPVSSRGVASQLPSPQQISLSHWTLLLTGMLDQTTVRSNLCSQTWVSIPWSLSSLRPCHKKSVLQTPPSVMRPSPHSVRQSFMQMQKASDRRMSNLRATSAWGTTMLSSPPLFCEMCVTSSHLSRRLLIMPIGHGKPRLVYSLHSVPA